MNMYIDILKKGNDLTEDEMISTMTAIMNGGWAHEEIKEFLVLLHKKGESVTEIAGAAKVMRDKANRIEAPYEAVDCCGTGGDNAGTYNISTAVALVAAAAGVPIAKHGNRAASSKSGTADVLESLGVYLDVPKEALEKALKEFHFAFLMAPRHHAAVKHVIPARKELEHRTMFNILGPLVNPAGTRFQLIGVFDRKWLVPMAETLKKLGSKGAWIVHGSDGLDEITISGPTYAAILDDEGNITEKTITPEHFGLPTYDLEKLRGGDPDENAQALRHLLEGHKSAYRDITLANAAVVLLLSGKCHDLKDGVKIAAEAIDSGHAMQLLSDYINFSRQYCDYC